LNIQSKGYATLATRADYFPKVVGSAVYFHFDSPLGSVVGTRLGAQIPINVINQNTSLTTLGAAQPITALLKVNAGVKIAQADEQIAQAQIEQGKRALAYGVEQLYWGLLAARQISAGAAQSITACEELAKMGTPETLIASAEARQGKAQADNQVGDIEGQLRILLDIPPTLVLDIIEPPLPSPPAASADEAAALALAISPEVCEAGQNIFKAQAAVQAAKVDYLPNVNVIGGYANLNGVPAIQQNIGYVGVMGSYTFYEWGKRKYTLSERETTVCMAQLKWQQTQDDVRLKAMKAFAELQQSRQALQMAEEFVVLRLEAEKTATDLTARIAATKARGLAQVEAVKARLAYQTAHANLATMTGRR
jgi:outer membrane protein TolC